MPIICAFAFSQGHEGRGRVMGYVYDEDGNPLDGVIQFFIKMASIDLKGVESLFTFAWPEPGRSRLRH